MATLQLLRPDAVCGDGYWDPWAEGCDDGNHVDADGCSASCENECTALHFDGIDDWVDLGNDPSINMTSDYTFTLWAWAEPTENVGRTLLSKVMGVTEKQMSLMVGSNASGPYMIIDYEQASNDWHMESPMNGEGWQFIAVSVASDLTVRVYSEGVMVASAVAPHEVDQSSASWVIGMLNGGYNTYHYGGYVRGVSMHHRELGQWEIAGIMDQGVLPEYGDDLVGYWPLDGAGELGAVDLSGNENHGVIHGAAWHPHVPGCL